MRKKGNDDMKQDKQAGGLAGIYQATSRGFGFLVPEDGGGREDDWFIPPRAEGGAWHGDRVLARPEDEGGEEGRRRTARITAVVERANKTVTGVLVRHNRGLWLRTDSDRLPSPIQVLTKRKGVRAGDRAAVAMTSFGSAKHPPMGTLREVFGPAGDRESAVAALLQARCEKLTEIPEKVDFFDQLPDYGVECFTNKKSKTNPEVSQAMLEAAIPALEGIGDWTADAVHDTLIALAEHLGVKNATLMWPVRIAAAGKLVTPGGAVEICHILGKDETLRRLRLGLDKLRA